MSTTRIALAVLCLLSIRSEFAEAALIDRGGGPIYDDVLNVTWMQDAQYSITSGYAPDGRLNWYDANTFAASVEYYDSVRDVVWSDWRLPTTLDNLASLGYDTTGSSSELAYMYYVNLGYAPNYAHDRFDPAPTSTLYNPFLNIAYRGYWSSTLSSYNDSAWMLHFHFGSQELNAPGDAQRVWLVRDGDVGVPEPGALALFGVGLLGVAMRRRREATAHEACAS